MINLALAYQAFERPKQSSVYSGVDRVINQFVGKIYKQTILFKSLFSTAQKVYDGGKFFIRLDDQELDKHLKMYHHTIRSGRYSDDELHQALGCICEASFRELGFKPYYVQIMGVLAQYYGFAIQMQPGEGKTITAAISGILAAWSGKPCHIITSNDYLAKRDRDLLDPLFSRCSLSSGSVIASMQSDERKRAYATDIVYGTGKEFLADFLRDSLVDEAPTYDALLLQILQGQNSSQKVMRGLYYAIIDEADSVLADEALTPLVISTKHEDNDFKVAITMLFEFLQTFESEHEYHVSTKHRQLEFADSGKEKLATFELPSFQWNRLDKKLFLSKQILMARHFYAREKQYVVHEEKVVIVDEKTGRLMFGKNWGLGLHQAVELQEGLAMSDLMKTQTKMSFQKFFRLYTKMSGMSGTLQGLEKELWGIYGMATIRIPKRKKNQYTIYPTQVFITLEEKNQALLDHIIQMHQTKRPILIGTENIHESETLYAQLQAKGVDCTLLNAKKHEEEDSIVAQAGHEGSVLIATNIAGRGTDIKIEEEVEHLGGLHVIGTQMASSKRIDMQLFGRTSRQGQKGSIVLFLSLEDRLIVEQTHPAILQTFKKFFRFSWTKNVVIGLYKLAQYRVDRFAMKLRYQMLQKDEAFEKSVSFSDFTH
jgi:preprotein translocase subunit SecA